MTEEWKYEGCDYDNGKFVRCVDNCPYFGDEFGCRAYRDKYGGKGRVKEVHEPETEQQHLIPQEIIYPFTRFGITKDQAVEIASCLGMGVSEGEGEDSEAVRRMLKILEPYCYEPICH